MAVNPSRTRRPPPQPTAWIAPAARLAFESEGTNAHRIASGADGWVERLGDDVMISHKNDAALQEFTAGLQTWSDQAGWAPTRVFTRFLPLKNQDRIAPVLQSGDAALPLTTVVTEAGVRYGLDFAAGYSHGLFLDQRANRARLRIMRPKRVLNTFAYTCSFTVVAGLVGAETVSVDLSRKSLDRGRQNLGLNDLTEDGHRFIAGDVLQVLPKMGHKGERFDAIILDPPTFSFGNDGRRWQVERHFEDLLLAALEVAAPGCAILLSTNCTKIDPASLERQGRACAKIRRRTPQFVRNATAVDFPAGHGASTLWMLLR